MKRQNGDIFFAPDHKMVKFFVGGQNVKKNSNVPLSKFTGNASVNFQWNEKEGEMYTLVVYDMTAGVCHLLTTNIVGGQDGGSIVFPFQAPSPPSGETHTYHVNVYSQGGESVNTNRKMRKFSLDRFVSTYHLHLVEETSFRVKGSGNTRMTSPSRVSQRSTRKSPSRRSPTKRTRGHVGYFKKGYLEGKEENYCACVLHLMGEGKVREPHAVCAKSTKTSVGRSNKCSLATKWENIPIHELRGYAIYHKISLPRNATKATIIKRIKEWKKGE